LSETLPPFSFGIRTTPIAVRSTSYVVPGRRPQKRWLRRLSNPVEVHAWIWQHNPAGVSPQKTQLSSDE
jgi:hypothetical protein